MSDANRSDFIPINRSETEVECFSLVGMAGAGKSTIGNALAEALGYAHVDTDDVIQASYGENLQELLDRVGTEAFRLIEESVVSGLTLRRCVISTGGSVVYGLKAVDRLRELGRILYVRASLALIKARVADGRDRGLVIAPGQTLDELFSEREPLYVSAADLTLDVDGLSVPECVNSIMRLIRA